jgi:hypothetical protein
VLGIDVLVASDGTMAKLDGTMLLLGVVITLREGTTVEASI